MKTPLKTTFRNLDHSDTLVARIQEEADKLDKCFDRITGCRVMVEMPHRHHRHGASFHVRIEVGVSGKQLVVAHDSTPHADGNDEPEGHQVRSPEAGETHKDVYVAIRDSFKVMRRQVEEYERTLRHDVKTHCAIPHAKIAKVFVKEGYGFIETPTGREIYFHKNSVVSAAFEHLAIGSEVFFHEEAGEKGPQASSVRLAGKRNLVGTPDE